jgi:putative aminopeptidase FrvX
VEEGGGVAVTCAEAVREDVGVAVGDEVETEVAVCEDNVGEAGASVGREGNGVVISAGDCGGDVRIRIKTRINKKTATINLKRS